MVTSSNLYISKRAAVEDKVKHEILKIWRPNEGPFQNIFRLFSYAVPFVPGLGWGIFILEKLASTIGFGLSDLGKAFDHALGLGPGSDVNRSSLDNMQEWLSKMLGGLQEPAVASLNDDQIRKVASLGGLLRLLGGTARLVPKIMTKIAGAIGWLLMAVGANNISEITQMAKNLAAGAIQDVMKEQMSPENMLGLLGE